MRKILWAAAALSVALAGCSGGATAKADEETRTKSGKVAKDEADSEGEGASEEEAPAPKAKPRKVADSSGEIGNWVIDSHECTATQMDGDDAIKVQQTSSAMNIYFVTDWSSELENGGTLKVQGEKVEASISPEDGRDWIMVSTPNDEFGGLHDIIENSASIKFSSGSNAKTFSLKDSNPVMDRLRKCAGL